MASHPIYQFYAVLDDYKPKIWRRFQVSNDITIARFCYILQVLFEMKANHLMMLEVPKGANFTEYFKKTYPDIYMASNDTIWRYEIWDEDYQPFNDIHKHIQVADATVEKLKYAVSEPGENMNFTYDFGDNWRISIRLEKVLVYKSLPAKEFPRALGGAGFGIVEGIGGVGGLADLAKAFKTKKGADYKQFSETACDDLVLSAFDLADMNFRLKRIPRIYKQYYEDKITPTQQSINLIERKYHRKRR